MDLEVRLYIERAENELRLANALFNLSENKRIKTMLKANENDTFYSAVISHAYYSIFYAAKSLLLTKGIKTKSPEIAKQQNNTDKNLLFAICETSYNILSICLFHNIHKKTYEEFKKHFVDTGILDTELLKIYKTMIIRADELLFLFEREKKKRGQFTYHTIAQANMPYAEESIRNARKFVENISEVLKTSAGA